jgi:hypothetical protein
MPNDKDDEEKARVTKKIEKLRGLKDRDFEIWQFFEKRADDIKGSLWTTATWLVALKSALLAFMLGDERIMQFTSDGLGLTPSAPTVVLVLSALGLALAFLTWAIVGDIAGHVRRNWLRASAAEKDPESVLRSSRIYILLPLGAVEVFFAVAFSVLMYVSFDRSQFHWAVAVFVMAASLVLVLYKSGKLEDRPEPTESSHRGHENGTPRRMP